MVTAKTLETILDDGIADAHFFNGRMLTAEALRSMRDANRLQHRQLATAIGEGVVHGLRVSQVGEPASPPDGEAGPQLRITPGLAFNRLGEATALMQPVDLALTEQIVDAPVEAGLFAECQPPSAFTNFGIYLLTVMPASGFTGFAPMVEIGGGVGTGCGRAFTVEGAKFRVFELPLAGLDATPLQTELSPLLQVIGAQIIKYSNAGDTTITKEMFRYRSSIAHYLLGSDIRAARSEDPLGAGADPQPGPIERLRQGPEPVLLDCEVPLAILHWSRRGIEFVDEWAVRRMRTAPSPTGATASLVAERRRGEALASVLQFQRQLDDIMNERTEEQLLAVNAVEYFRYLPSGGLFPRGLGGKKGFSVGVFLRDVLHRPLEPPTDGSPPPVPERLNTTAEFLPDEALPGLLMSALDYAPLDLVDSDDWRGVEMIWLFTVIANQRAFEKDVQVAPYVVFTAPHVPYTNQARFDIARFDYSNYADCAGCDRPHRITAAQRT